MILSLCLIECRILIWGSSFFRILKALLHYHLASNIAVLKFKVIIILDHSLYVTFYFKHIYFWKHSGFRVLKFSHWYMYFLNFLCEAFSGGPFSLQVDGFQFWRIFLTYFVDCLISVFSFWTSYYVIC